MEHSLFEYYQPEKESFKKFIFRDSKGLYKYEGVFPNLLKVYINENIDKANYNRNICEKLRLRDDELRKCYHFFVKLLVELKNGKALNKILSDISRIVDSDEDFFDLATEEINKMDINLALNILKNLGFQIYKEHIGFGRYINNIERVQNWSVRLSPENKNIIRRKIPFFFNYLQLLVNYVNYNPAIINKEWTVFDEELFDILHLERFMNTNYNKSVIYNEILSGYLENFNDDKLGIFLYILSRDFDYEKKSSFFLQDILKNNIDTFADINKFNPKYAREFIRIARKFLTKNRRFIELEKSLFEKLEILIKYLLINPKNMKNQNITMEEIADEIGIFLKLKKDLHDKKNHFLSKYPRNIFFY